ncbi:MAG: hypothetical protein ACXWKU_22080, partial [Caulobacteraceae bacterium]
MTDPVFNLFALNTTTCCVVPGVFVNGPVRHELGLPYAAGCFGGDAGPAPAIGRALRLLMRNVGGQVVGVSSKSVFGQPGRVTGIVVAEWEERSPWAPLAQRRGAPAGETALPVRTALPFSVPPGRKTVRTQSKGEQTSINQFFNMVNF